MFNYKKINQQTATVEIYSTQASQHVCAIKGTANVVDGKLILYFGAEKNKQYLTFTPHKSSVLLKQYVPIGENVENCGVHANFEGLVFKKLDENTTRYRCFDD